MKSDWLKRYWTLGVYLLITLGLVVAQLYYGLKANLPSTEMWGIGIFSLWLLIIGLIDFFLMQIPLWLTAPVMLAALAWRFLDKTVYEDPLIGFGLNTFMSACGLSMGIVVADLITHFGNWFAKYKSSVQGLLALWLALPLMVINAFIPFNYPLWVLLLLILLFRAVLQWLYLKNTNFKMALDWLFEKPWLAYLFLFVVLLSSAYYNLYDIQQSTILKGLRMNLVIFSLCFALLTEEILVPFVVKLCKFPVPEEETQAVLGGGDAMLSGAIGSLWGPIVVLNCLQLSFLVALLVLGPFKLIQWLRKKESSANMLNEVPFAPFITFSAQIILLAEVLVKLSK